MKRFDGQRTRRVNTPSELRRSKWYVPQNDVVLGKRIGAGASGQVYRGTFRGKVVALKQSYRQMMRESEVDDIDAEFSILSKLRHKGIVKMLGITEVDGVFFLITEYCPIQVENYLLSPMQSNESRSFSVTDTTFEQSASWMRLLHTVHIGLDVARALAYMHQKGYVHRDLKPSNIVMTEDHVVKLCDFGTSRKVEDGNKQRLPRVSIEVGTPPFMAPELFPFRSISAEEYEANDGKIFDRIDCRKTDVYAFGMTMWSLLCAQTPFENKSRHEVQEALRRRDRPHVPEFWPEPLRALICCCWQHPYAHRPTFTEVVCALELFITEQLQLTVTQQRAKPYRSKLMGQPGGLTKNRSKKPSHFRTTRPRLVSKRAAIRFDARLQRGFNKRDYTYKSLVNCHEDGKSDENIDGSHPQNKSITPKAGRQHTKIVKNSGNSTVSICSRSFNTTDKCNDPYTVTNTRTSDICNGTRSGDKWKTCRSRKSTLENFDREHTTKSTSTSRHRLIDDFHFHCCSSSDVTSFRQRQFTHNECEKGYLLRRQIRSADASFNLCNEKHESSTLCRSQVHSHDPQTTHKRYSDRSLRNTQMEVRALSTKVGKHKSTSAQGFQLFRSILHLKPEPSPSQIQLKVQSPSVEELSLFTENSICPIPVSDKILSSLNKRHRPSKDIAATVTMLI